MTRPARSAWKSRRRFARIMERDGAVGRDGYLSGWDRLDDRRIHVMMLSRSKGVGTITSKQGVGRTHAAALPFRIKGDQVHLEAFTAATRWVFKSPKLREKRPPVVTGDLRFRVRVTTRPRAAAASVVGIGSRGRAVALQGRITRGDNGWQIRASRRRALPDGHYAVTWVGSFHHALDAAVLELTVR